ncbi:MAG: hypothetical protein ACAH80_00180 [Alphaproteobacteria bacterium]
MRNNFIFTLAILGAMLPQTFSFADEPRSALVPEVPLMPGMVEIKEAGNRPGETTAIITGNERMVLSYYFGALQDEGWEPIDAAHTQYKRGEQTLGLGANWEKGKTTVRFKVWPVSKQPEEENKQPTPEELLNNGTTSTEE